MLGRFLTAGLFSAALILANLVFGTPKEASPAAHINNSVNSVKAQTVQAEANESKQGQGQTVPPLPQEPSPQPSKNTELTGVEPEKPQAKQTVAVQETPVLTPKEQAKATLEDLGQGDAWYAVEYIGFKESSWNPAAINHIGACGLFQALPCEKMHCELSDIPCQVRWATSYASQRYGGWHYAYNFWKKNHWW